MVFEKKIFCFFLSTLTTMSSTEDTSKRVSEDSVDSTKKKEEDESSESMGDSDSENPVEDKGVEKPEDEKTEPAKKKEKPESSITLHIGSSDVNKIFATSSISALIDQTNEVFKKKPRQDQIGLGEMMTSSKSSTAKKQKQEHKAFDCESHADVATFQKFIHGNSIVPAVVGIMTSLSSANGRKTIGVEDLRATVSHYFGASSKWHEACQDNITDNYQKYQELAKKHPKVPATA
jgi:hypothetical protein